MITSPTYIIHVDYRLPSATYKYHRQVWATNIDNVKSYIHYNDCCACQVCNNHRRCNVCNNHQSQVCNEHQQCQVVIMQLILRMHCNPHPLLTVFGGSISFLFPSLVFIQHFHFCQFYPFYCTEWFYSAGTWINRSLSFSDSDKLIIIILI